MSVGFGLTDVSGARADTQAADAVMVPGTFSCVAVPADAPTPPPLPSFAMSDRREAGLADAAPLCPAGEIPAAGAIYGHPYHAHGEPASSTTTTTLAASTPPVHEESSTCTGQLGVYYCHAFEDQAGLRDDEMYTTMDVYTPAVGDTGHSLAQLWALGGQTVNGYPATLETGWSVSPSQWGDAQAHLFEFHQGDGYANDCYDGCGFTAVEGTPVAAGAVLSTGSHTFGVVLSGEDWWFYLDGYYFGYVPQGDPSWAGNPIPRITEAQVGGEVASASPTPATQMGDGSPGTSASGAAVTDTIVHPEGKPYFPQTYLVPSGYYLYGSGEYSLGRFDPSRGGFAYGGPGG